MSKILKIPKPVYNIYHEHSEFGDFGLIKMRPKRMAEWHDCRELFHGDHSDPRKIFLFKAPNRFQTKKFIRHAEKILGLGRKYKCGFVKTSDPDVLGIRPGPFWSIKRRIYLMTILLRASTNYNVKQKNFWETCKWEEYLEDTWEAFERFMAGNTEIVKGDGGFGWVNDFTGRTKLSLRNPLRWQAYLKKDSIDKIREKIKKRHRSK